MANMGDAWIAASVGLFTGILGAAVTVIINERRTLREHRLDLSAEALARRLLKHSKWRLRSFPMIKRHLGGFEDNALRQILVRAGAVRFEGKDNTEWWGLIQRNKNLLSGEEKPPTADELCMNAHPNVSDARLSPAVLPSNLKHAAPNDAPAPLSPAPEAGQSRSGGQPLGPS